METIQFHTVNHSELISLRKGERKLGESIQIFNEETTNISSAKFVIFGIQEDVGIRRNGGIGNDTQTYLAFLRAFLSIQENDFLQGNLFLLDGYFTISDETDDCIDLLDKKVSEKVTQILSINKIPIIIGGGHNNVYGILKACADFIRHPVNVINLDAHADIRSTESRHSGNGFSKALEDNFLKKYAILGLHEAYNNQFILDNIKQNSNIHAVFFEDIVLRKKISFESALQDCIEFISDTAFGVEWDVDCMENVLSSAVTPIGWHSHHILQYLYNCARHDSLYLHISEAVNTRADGLKNPTVGKLLSYAVQAFVKGVLEK